jgi:hypothetical protein
VAGLGGLADGEVEGGAGQLAGGALGGEAGHNGQPDRVAEGGQDRGEVQGVAVGVDELGGPRWIPCGRGRGGGSGPSRTCC